MTNKILAVLIAAILLPLIPSHHGSVAKAVPKATLLITNHQLIQSVIVKPVPVRPKPPKPVVAVVKVAPVPKPPETPKPAPVAAVQPTPPVTSQPATLPPNAAKTFIYQHESGNNPLSVNRSSGACGLGQSLPCAKVLSACPDMNYACQDAWFTAYAYARYGGWDQAYQFWLAHRYW